jgi:hypothetical protein
LRETLSRLPFDNDKNCNRIHRGNHRCCSVIADIVIIPRCALNEEVAQFALTATWNGID